MNSAWVVALRLAMREYRLSAGLGGRRRNLPVIYGCQLLAPYYAETYVFDPTVIMCVGKWSFVSTDR